MIKVIFWNINDRGDEFYPTLAKVAKDTDILILAESKMLDSQIKANLGLERVPFKLTSDEREYSPKLYTKIPLTKIEHYSSYTSKRMSFYLLQTKDYDEIIIGSIHFPSKATYNGATQLSIALGYASEVREVEKQRKHSRTILLGDFNMNPFEPGMIEPMAFNATLSYEIAKSGTRTLHYNTFPYFYNPMWNWLGDREYNTGNHKLPGTFYYKTTSDVSQIFWNVFDKVIIRPEVIDALDYASIKIEESIPRLTLINQKFDITPDNFTDHLPLSFNLKIAL